MIENIDIEKILFLDIETAPSYSNYNELPENFKKLWDKKANKILKNEETTPDVLYERAGIYSEFGKIICISVGIVKSNEVRLKSFFSDDEKKILLDFAKMLKTKFNPKYNLLCAHNGKEFDFPYIARRMLVNGVKLPEMLDIAGKKPWEISHLDTMELWKFGDYKNYTSLELLTAIFNIPTPKDDIDGSMVGEIYWIEKDLTRIVKYCQKDVLAIVQLFLKYQGKQLIDEDKVVIVE